VPCLSAELFKRLAKVEMLHVPYRGAGPALNDLLPGRVDVIFNNIGAVLPLIQSGRLRGLGVTSASDSLIRQMEARRTQVASACPASPVAFLGLRCAPRNCRQ
jgi:hypothetical protein